jgi:hypothetical protein
MDLLSGDAMISGGKQLANHELYCGKASLKFNGPLIDPLHFFTFNPSSISRRSVPQPQAARKRDFPGWKDC